MSLFDDRAANARRRLDELARSLRPHLGDDEQRLLGNHTCIYTVGSGARGEMSEHSDVDLFVARVEGEVSAHDERLIIQAITRTLAQLGLPQPSRDGAFLKMHTLQYLCDRMGTTDDDSSNALTARMLLLLESRALIGEGTYTVLLKGVLGAYWKDAVDHADDFQPFVLVNDIVRYWRILLLNYVAKNAEKERELGPPKLKAERKLRSYKLRFSRCLTCFSTLARFLVATAEGGITMDEARTIVGERPLERLLAVKNRVPSAGPFVDEMLALYEQFLKHTDQPKASLIESFCLPEFASDRAHDGRNFADAMFGLLQELGREGRGKELFRHMVV